MPFQKGRSGNPNGKPKGVRAKATVAREADIKASGLTPIDFMLSTLRDETQEFAVRADMAKAAAPYVHPKLAQVQYEDKTPREDLLNLRVLSEDQLFALEDIANALLQRRQASAAIEAADDEDED